MFGSMLTREKSPREKSCTNGLLSIRVLKCCGGFIIAGFIGAGCHKRTVVTLLSGGRRPVLFHTALVVSPDYIPEVGN